MVLLSNHTGPGGGIGRRAGLKILFSQESAGSIPALGTNPETFLEKRFQRFQKRLLYKLSPGTTFCISRTFRNEYSLQEGLFS